MKKITSLQFMMLMSLAVGSVQVYSQNQDFSNQAVQLSLKSDRTEDLDDTVLQKLAESSPAAIESLLIEEEELIPTFSEIKNVVNKANKMIEKLSKKSEVHETEIARIAVQLADTQAALEKAVALQRAKHKQNHKLEQVISDALKKAEQGLKALNDRAMQIASIVKETVSEKMQTASKKVKQATKKLRAQKSQEAANAREDAIIDQAIDNAMMDDQVVVQYTGYEVRPGVAD